MSAQRQPDRLGRRILWGVIFGVVVYGVLAAVTDVRTVGSTLAAFPVATFVAALGLSVGNYAVRWAKWHYYLRHLGFAVPVGESVVVFLAGLTMSITPGKVGEVLKSVLLHQSRGTSIAATAPIVVAERLTDLFGLFVIAAFGIAVFDFGRVAFIVVLAALALGMGFLQFPGLVSRLLDVVEKLPWFGALRPRFDEAYESMRVLVRGVPMLVATALSTVSWSMEALAFHWIVAALNPLRLELDLSAFVYSMTTILGAVSFLPGGLGVTEGSMIGALLLFGVFQDEASATAATYLIRIATLWFAVGIGACALLVFRRRFVE